MWNIGVKGDEVIFCQFSFLKTVVQGVGDVLYPPLLFPYCSLPSPPPHLLSNMYTPHPLPYCPIHSPPPPLETFPSTSRQLDDILSLLTFTRNL